jgi:trigger factor
MAFSKKNLALLKSALAEELAEKQKEEAELEADQRFVEEILNLAQFEVPQVLIEQVLVEKMNRLKEEAKRAGLSFADYLAMLKTTEKELWDSLKEIAAKEAKIAVILSEIVKKEGLKFEQEVNLIREVRKHLNNQ